MVLLLLTFCLLLRPLWEYLIVLYCVTLLYVRSSIAIILMEKRELVALLNLSSWCLMMVEWLFLAVPWGCLRFVIVVFPDHTHYFSKINVIDRRACNLLLADFCHNDFLILKYIWHRLKYASPQRKVTLLCNIKLIYVTQNILNNILVPMLRYS